MQEQYCDNNHQKNMQLQTKTANELKKDIKDLEKRKAEEEKRENKFSFKTKWYGAPELKRMAKKEISA